MFTAGATSGNVIDLVMVSSVLNVSPPLVNELTLFLVVAVARVDDGVVATFKELTSRGAGTTSGKATDLVRVSSVLNVSLPAVVELGSMIDVAAVV